MTKSTNSLISYRYTLHNKSLTNFYILDISRESSRTMDIKKEMLETWRKEIDFFVETDDSKGIMHVLKHNQIILIRGGPGSGKTLTAFFIAFKLEMEDNYMVFPSHKPKDIIKFTAEDGRTIFIFDDLFGRFALNRKSFEKWDDNENRFSINSMLKKYPKLKLIITCRSQITTNSILKGFEHIGFCYQMNLSVHDKKMIAQQYCKNIPNDLFDERLYANLPFFPLLCKKLHELSDDNIEGCNLETITTEIVFKEVIELKKNGPLAFLTLGLLIVNNNAVLKEMFKIKGKLTEQILPSLMREYKYDFYPSANDILETLYELKGSYLIENDIAFIAISNTMYNCILCNVGKYFCSTILTFAEDSLIKGRIILQSLKSADHLRSVPVPGHLEYSYFDRIVAMLRKGNIKDALSNLQSNDADYRLKLMKYCKKYAIDLNGFTETEDGCSTLHVCAQFGYMDIANFILQTDNGLLDKTNGSGKIPLQVACAYGFCDMVNFLLEYNSNKAIIDVNALLLLHICCMHGHKELAEIFIRKGADINLCSSKHGTPIFVAVSNNRLEVIHVLLSYGADINKGTDSGATPLHAACQNKQIDSVLFLLQHNTAVDINKADNNGCTPLYIACQNGYYDIADTLIINEREKIAVNKADANGLAPIHVAVSGGHLRLTELLLHQNAFVDKISKKGFTPLYFACQTGNIDIVKLLLRRRADINGRSEICSRTPLFSAYEKKHYYIVNHLIKRVSALRTTKYMFLFTACSMEDIETVEYLLQNKKLSIDINYIKFGETVLYIASKKGNAKLVELLLQYNPDINFLSKTGWTALCFSCKNGDKNSVESLIKHKASVNLATRSHLTPLFLSCLHGHIDIIDLLIHHHAYLDEGDRNGWTPLQISCYIGKVGIVDKLLKGKVKMERKSHLKINRQKSVRKKKVQNYYKIKQTPLCIACWQCNDASIQIIMDAGADINQGGTSDCFNSTLDTCDRYVKSRLGYYQISSKETFEETTKLNPLQIACYKNNTDIIRLLLMNNAAVNISRPKSIMTKDVYKHSQYSDKMHKSVVTSPKVTPLNIAIQKGQIIIIRKLIEHGANINIPSLTGCTPMHLAIEYDKTKCFEIVNLLLERKYNCEINHYMHGVGTPLYLACSKNEPKIVEMLIKQKAEVNQVGDGGQTALQIACAQGSEDIVKMLLEHGAELHSEGQQGPSPLEIATPTNFPVIYSILKSYNVAVKTRTDFGIFHSKKKM